MASLAATLLCYYDEEKCFVMLVRMWQLRGLERLYQPGFGYLMAALRDLEKHWLAGKDVARKLVRQQPPLTHLSPASGLESGGLTTNPRPSMNSTSTPRPTGLAGT